MTERLREELLRIGETAEPVGISADLWARGRRARRRARVGAAATVVVAVLLMLGSLGLLAGLAGPAGRELPPARGEGEGAGAVPSVIYGVPARLADFSEEHARSWDPRIAERDLAIGRGSVAFTLGQMRPGAVVVTARDGAYHLLELPGWIGTGIGAASSGGALALSPDGRQLAWAWWDAEAPDSAARPAGVRVADLESGAVRTVALTGRDGVIVDTLSWSPDSRWLAWTGRAQDVWTTTRTSSGANAAVAGRIPPGAEQSQPVPLDRSSTAIAIGSTGEVVLLSGDRWRTWDGRRTAQGALVHQGDRLAGPSEGRAGAVARDGATVALRTFGPVGAFEFLAAASSSGEGQGSREESRAQLTGAPLPTDRYPEGATIEPVGWLDADHVVAVVQAAEGVSGGGWTSGGPELVVASAPGAGEEYFRVVATVHEEPEEPDGVYGLSVAVDLMSLEHPTEEFPAPDWPMSDERKAMLVGAAVLAVMVLGWVAVHLVRRRRVSRPAP